MPKSRPPSRLKQERVTTRPGSLTLQGLRAMALKMVKRLVLTPMALLSARRAVKVKPVRRRPFRMPNAGEILPEALQPWPDPDGSGVLTGQRGVPHVGKGAPVRGQHAAVELHLLGQFGIHAATVKPVSQAAREFRHGPPPMLFGVRAGSRPPCARSRHVRQPVACGRRR